MKKIFSAITLLLVASTATWYFWPQPKPEDYIDIAQDFAFTETLPYAHMANFAYKSPQQVDSDSELKTLIERKCAAKIIANRIINDDDKEGICRYFIFKSDNKQTIAVRGTATSTEWIKNIQYIKVRDDKLGIQLHKGFRDLSKLIYDDINANNLLDKSVPLDLTGHSLGGAIATILMLYYEKDGFQIDTVFTFGQPRVTNEEGAAKYAAIFGSEANARYQRILNVGQVEDVVSVIPPNSLIGVQNGAYQHFGPEIVMLGDKKHYVYGWLKKLAEEVQKGLAKEIRELTDPFVQAHDIENYIKGIEQLRQTAKRVGNSARSNPQFKAQ